MQIPLGPINDRVILRGMDGKSQHTHPTSQRRNEKASEPLTGQQLDSREPSPFQRSPEPPSLHQPRRHAMLYLQIVPEDLQVTGLLFGLRVPLLPPPRPPLRWSPSELRACRCPLRPPRAPRPCPCSSQPTSRVPPSRPLPGGASPGGLWAAEIRLGGRGRGARVREAGEGGARAGEAPEGAQGRSAFRASRPRRGGGRGF